MKSFAIITHTNYIDNQYVKGPADTLAEYLYSENKRNVQLISLGFNGNRSNRVLQNGVEVKRKNYNIGIFKYIADIIFIRRNISKSDIYIAVDPISFISTCCYKKRVILYLVDYSEKRSSNLVTNLIYQIAIWISIRRAMLVISAAEKIFLKLNVPEGKRVFLPNYPLMKRPSKSKEYDGINSVLPFTDLKKLNYKLIIDSIAQVKKQIYPINFKLDFIGIKPIEEELIEYIKFKKLNNCINYLYINDKKFYFSKINSYNLGFDINNDKYSYSEYRDPIKVREYIFFGIPIITNKNNAIYEEIEKNEIGVVINSEEDLVNTLSMIINHKINHKQLQINVRDYYNFDIESLLLRLSMMHKIVLP